MHLWYLSTINHKMYVCLKHTTVHKVSLINSINQSIEDKELLLSSNKNKVIMKITSLSFASIPLAAAFTPPANQATVQNNSLSAEASVSALQHQPSLSSITPTTLPNDWPVSSSLSKARLHQWLHFHHQPSQSSIHSVCTPTTLPNDWMVSSSLSKALLD